MFSTISVVGRSRSCSLTPTAVPTLSDTSRVPDVPGWSTTPASLPLRVPARGPPVGGV
ncbi:hypothetical protein GCM10027194_26630 [Thalassiella azotivora]